MPVDSVFVIFFIMVWSQFGDSGRGGFSRIAEFPRDWSSQQSPSEPTMVKSAGGRGHGVQSLDGNFFSAKDWLCEV